MEQQASKVAASARRLKGLSVRVDTTAVVGSAYLPDAASRRLCTTQEVHARLVVLAYFAFSNWLLNHRTSVGKAGSGRAAGKTKLVPASAQYQREARAALATVQSSPGGAAWLAANRCLMGDGPRLLDEMLSSNGYNVCLGWSRKSHVKRDDRPLTITHPWCIVSNVAVYAHGSASVVCDCSRAEKGGGRTDDPAS